MSSDQRIQHNFNLICSCSGFLLWLCLKNFEPFVACTTNCLAVQMRSELQQSRWQVARAVESDTRQFEALRYDFRSWFAYGCNIVRVSEKDIILARSDAQIECKLEGSATIHPTELTSAYRTCQVGELCLRGEINERKLTHICMHWNIIAI